MSETPNNGGPVGGLDNDPTFLAPQHTAMLQASGITGKHAQLRGYETITDTARLANIGIAKTARNTPGLLIPLRRKDNTAWGYHYRPDKPRTRANGKTVKYENPVGQRNGIDVPPGVGPRLDDPTEPLWITEGTKKADSGAMQGLCIVALTGVWNWRGTNTSGGKTAIADFNDIALNGRRVILAFDGDIARKPEVRKALAALASWLKTRDAKVEYLHLPDTDTGKIGLDDYLADHDVESLWSLVRPEMPPVRNGTTIEITTGAGDQVRQMPQVANETAAQDDSDIEVIPDGRQFIDPHDGLLSLKLALQVMKDVVCGWNRHEQRFYIYRNGVWIPEKQQGAIKESVTRWLGDKHRVSHLRNVTDHIEARAQQISREPQHDWINVTNGMLDWRTGTLHPHQPHYGSTIQLPVAYDENADCPAFLDYLTQVLPPDCLETSDDCPHGFMWELIGYTIYSGNPHHIAVLLYGSGRNGKGRLIHALECLLGKHNCATTSIHDLVGDRFATVDLYGKLANLAGDIHGGWLESTAEFKKITGGDTIRAQHKYGDAFDFTPYALPFYSTNRIFTASDGSAGWFARWVVIKFPNEFIGHEDRNIDAKITKPTELQGILRRATQALPHLMARGRLTEPQSVADAKAEFVTKSNTLQDFLTDACVLDRDAWTPRTTIYNRYCSWTLDNGHKSLSSNEFYTRVGEVRGIGERRRRDGRYLVGIRLRGPSDDHETVTPDGAAMTEVTGVTGALTPTRVYRGKGREAVTPVTPTGSRTGFIPATDPDRCPECRWHIPTQGHQPGGCSQHQGVLDGL